LITREVFKKVNGLSNRYWGWGLEDDEFYARLRDADQPVERPTGVTTGKKDSFKHIHHTQVSQYKEKNLLWLKQLIFELFDPI